MGNSTTITSFFQSSQGTGWPGGVEDRYLTGDAARMTKLALPLRKIQSSWWSRAMAAMY